MDQLRHMLHNASALRSFRSAAVLTLFAWVGVGAAATHEDAVSSFVEINGHGASPLVSANGGFRRVISSDGAIVPSDLVLRIPVGISKALSQWLVDAVTAAQPVDVKTAVVRVTQGGVLERLTLTRPLLKRVELTGLGSDPASVELLAILTSSDVKPEGPGQMGAPTTARSVASGRLHFGDLQVTPLSIEGVGMELEFEYSTARGKAIARCNDFAIVSPYSDASGLYDWYRLTVPPGVGRATLLPRTAELFLLDAAGKSLPLAQITGVVITGFETFVEDGALRVRATFSCSAFALTPDAMT